MEKKNREEKKKKEKTDDYSGHYVIASSGWPEPRPLERRTLVPIILTIANTYSKLYYMLLHVHNTTV